MVPIRNNSLKNPFSRLALLVAMAVTTASPATAEPGNFEKASRTRQLFATQPANPGPGCFVDALLDDKTIFSEVAGRIQAFTLTTPHFNGIRFQRME